MHTILTDLCVSYVFHPAQLTVLIWSKSFTKWTAKNCRTKWFKTTAHIQREEKRRIHRKGPVVKLTHNFLQSSLKHLMIYPNHWEAERSNCKWRKNDYAKIRTQIKKLEKQLSVREKNVFNLMNYNSNSLNYRNGRQKYDEKADSNFLWTPQRPSPETELKYSSPFELLSCYRLKQLTLA